MKFILGLVANEKKFYFICALRRTVLGEVLIITWTTRKKPSSGP